MSDFDLREAIRIPSAWLALAYHTIHGHTGEQAAAGRALAELILEASEPKP